MRKIFKKLISFNILSDSTGLLRPVGATDRTSDKPLEINAPTLHPLPKNQSKTTASLATEQPLTDKSKIQFNSAIGSKNSRKLDPFAEQNAERAEKLKERTKKRKRVIIASAIVGGVLLLGAIVWVIWIIVQPKPEPLPVPPVTIENGSTEEITEIQDQAQQIYDNNSNINPIDPSTEDIKVVDQLFTEIIDSPSGKEYPDQVRLAQLMFYVENNFYDQARKTLDEIDPSRLDKEQQALYYNYAGTIYNKFDENEKSDEAYREATKIRFELGGFGG